LESLDVLKATEKRFVPALDWRPKPGTPDAAEAEKLRSAYKGPSSPPAEDEQPKKKKNKKKA
jgi:hypothetical protein